MTTDAEQINTIVKITQQWFGDIYSIRDDRHKLYQCGTALQKILSFLQMRSHLLLKEDDASRGSFKDFGRWMMFHMIRILNEKNFQKYHQEIISSIKSTLVEYKCKKQNMYCDIVNRLTSMLVDAAEARYSLEDSYITPEISLHCHNSNETIMISSVDQCEAFLHHVLTLLTSNTTVCEELINDVWRSCGQLLEVSPSNVKVDAIRLLIAWNPENTIDSEAPEFNYVVNVVMALIRYHYKDFPEVHESASEFLKMITSKHELLSPHTSHQLYELSLLILENNFAAYMEWAIEFIELIFTLPKDASKESCSPCTLIRDIPDAITEQLEADSYDIERVITILTTQIISQGFKVLKTLRKIIHFDALKATPPSATRNKHAQNTVSEKILKFLLKLYDTAQLKLLNTITSSDSTAALSPYAFTLVKLLWRFIVSLSIPHHLPLLQNKIPSVVHFLDTISQPSYYDLIFSMLCDTLLPYFPSESPIPPLLKEFSKKILSVVSLNSLSGPTYGYVLHCYILLQSYSSSNLSYFIEPIRNGSSTNKDVYIVPALIRLFPLLTKQQKHDATKMLTFSKSSCVLNEVARFLDQLVFANSGRELRIDMDYYVRAERESHTCPDLIDTLRYSNESKGHDVPSAVLLSVLNLFDKSTPPVTLLHALSHLSTLALSLHTEQLLSKVITLSLHYDNAVRHELAEQCLHFKSLRMRVDQQLPNKLSEAELKVVLTLKEAGAYGDISENVDQLKTCVLTMVNLGCNARNVFLKNLLQLIMFAFLNAEQLLHFITCGLEKIAKHQRLSGVAELFDLYNVTICELLASKILDHSDMMLDHIEDVAGAFFHAKSNPNITYFVEKQIQHLLPSILAYGSKTPQHGDVSRAVLRTLRDITKQTNKMMIGNNFMTIFTKVSRLSENQQEVIKFIENVSSSSLSQLMLYSVQGIYNNLLLYIAQDRGSVVWGLNMLDANVPKSVTASSSDTSTGSGESSSDAAITKLVEPRLLALLASFSYLQLEKLTEETTLVLESVNELMKIIGSKRVTKWKNKIISILRNGLNADKLEVKHDALVAWETFVRIGEGKCIGALAGEIVTILLPCIDSFPDLVTRTVKHLLQDRWTELQHYVGDIRWLSIPPHRNLLAIRERYDDTRSKDLSLEEFKSYLSCFIAAITRESAEVRLHSLESLRHFLYNNQHTIHQLILGNESVDPVVTQLISTLLSGVQDSNNDCKLLFCTCLGEVGAVDEGLLESVVTTKTSNQRVFLNGIEDKEFGIELLNVLAKGYKHCSDQGKEDKYAFVIQETLAAYRQHDDQIYKNLSSYFEESVWEILELHQNSKYIIQSHVAPEMVCPVFQSSAGPSFETWLKTWSKILLKLVLDVESTKLAGSLMNPLKIITSTHTETLQFLLPNLVLQILLKGTQNAIDYVLTEIQSVLYATQNEAVKCDKTKLIAQTIFSLIDYLTIWINKKRDIKNDKKSGSKGSSVVPITKKSGEVDLVERVLKKVSKDMIAVSAFHCGAYNRAIMYLEYKPQLVDQNDWGLLQKIYVAMGEFDGVAGVKAARTTAASLKEHIQVRETAGKDTLPMYEQGMIQHADDLFFTRGLCKLMLSRGQLKSLMHLVNDMVEKQPNLLSTVNEYRVQAAWSLARWDLLEDYLHVDSTPSWAASVGRQILAARGSRMDQLTEYLTVARRDQLASLSAAVMEGRGYVRCYGNMMNLHILHDIERWCTWLLSDTAPTVDTLKCLTDECNKRVELISDTWRTREPFYNIHRTLLHVAADCNANMAGHVNDTLGVTWLRSAKLARKELLMPCADSVLQNAALFSPVQYKIELARWLWDKDEHEEAMTQLKSYLEDIDTTSSTTKRRLAEAKLLYAEWSEKTAYFDSEEIMQLFKNVTETDGCWEEGHFQMANYLFTWSKALSTSLRHSIMPHIIKHYGESVKFGTYNIFQSLPRLLTTWFELEDADRNAALSSSQRIAPSQVENRSRNMDQANQYVSQLIESLPAYLWLTVFSQLLSRICHPSEAVYTKVIEIGSEVLFYYPQQAMWQIYALTNNQNKDRAERATEIIKRALNKYAQRETVNGRDATWFKTFYKDFKHLCKGLYGIGSRDTGHNLVLNMSKDFRPMKRMLEDVNFTPIILPIQRNITVTLPVGQGPHTGHQPFPHHLVTITSIKDDINVLPSLQRPKKITIVGSNGRTYGLLCKPKDDLRKDQRFMEFNMMVNRLLKKDVTARKTQLQIRTYAVTPLSENSGLVEWVDNTRLLRGVLRSLYEEHKMGISGNETRAIFEKLKEIKKKNITSSVKTKEFVDLFKKKILPRHPPVLAEWFRRMFCEPSRWFTARQKYIHTTAVISMVGYVVGLGDRHAENIMFDMKTGETVHVDFDCLFEKGETFDWPEKVPFRLTHNMVHAFGVTGIEGMFRLSCIATMKVMRNEKESLVSVLQAFVHDPLVEWAKQERRSSNLDRGRQSVRNDATTIMKDKAQRIMKTIEDKLKGQMGKHSYANLPISPSGQVDKLISDATSQENLSQMYIGWTPYY